MDPPDETGRETHEDELVVERRVPHRVESAREVDGRENGASSRFRSVEAIGDRLGKAEDLIDRRVAGTEARLEVGEDAVGFEEVEETDEDEALKEFGEAGGKSNRAIRAGKVSRLGRFEDRDNLGKLPGGGEGLGGPREVENVKEKEEGGVRKVGEERVGQALGIQGSGTRERGDSLSKLGEGEGRAEGRVGGRRADGGANRTKVGLLPRTDRFGRGRGEMPRIELGEGVRLALARGGTLNSGIRGGGGGQARHGAEEGIDTPRVRSRREGGGRFLPRCTLCFRNGAAGMPGGRDVRLAVCIRSVGTGKSLSALRNGRLNFARPPSLRRLLNAAERNGAFGSTKQESGERGGSGGESEGGEGI